MAGRHVRRSLVEHILRCSVLVTALFIMSLGIAFSAGADLGVSPISCTPYILSMGVITILMHLGFVAVQAALLKRKFRPVRLLQIPVVFIFGVLTDFSMWLMAPLEPSGYIWFVILPNSSNSNSKPLKPGWTARWLCSPALPEADAEDIQGEISLA